MTALSSHNRTTRGAYGNTGCSARRMPNSRAMSCAFGGTGPSGARRNTYSPDAARSRYVKFECPPGNCSTATVSPNHADSRSSGSSSPARTGAVSLIQTIETRAPIPTARAGQMYQGVFSHSEKLLGDAPAKRPICRTRPDHPLQTLTFNRASMACRGPRKSTKTLQLSTHRHTEPRPSGSGRHRHGRASSIQRPSNSDFNSANHGSY